MHWFLFVYSQFKNRPVRVHIKGYNNIINHRYLSLYYSKNMLILHKQSELIQNPWNNSERYKYTNIFILRFVLETKNIYKNFTSFYDKPRTSMSSILPRCHWTFSTTLTQVDAHSVVSWTIKTMPVKSRKEIKEN